jgi:hypothetical protein
MIFELLELSEVSAKRSERQSMIAVANKNGTKGAESYSLD